LRKKRGGGGGGSDLAGEERRRAVVVGYSNSYLTRGEERRGMKLVVAAICLFSENIEID
jgi:hypothetical protein